MKLFFEDETQNTVQFEMGATHLRIEKKGEQVVEEYFEDMQAMSAFFSAEIEVLMKTGYSQRLLPEDRICAPDVAKEYFEHSFFDELKNDFGVDPGDCEGLLEHLEETHGIKLPPQLRTFIAFRDNHPFNSFSFGDVSFSKSDCSHSRFEDAVLADQKDTESFQMIKDFVGAIELGKKGKDTYLAVPHEYAPERAEIWLFSEENASPSHAIAADIASFFYAHHLLDSSWYGGDLKDIAAQFRPVKDRVLCENLSEKIGVPSIYISDSKDDLPYIFNRCYWISYLFRQDEDLDLDDIAAAFHIEVHTPQVWEKVRRFRFIQETPTTQMYWLWRLFWFDRQADLAECIELTQTSPSAFVRSSVELIKEFESGRKEIGKIEDIHALRKRWVALGLDPALSEKNLQADADAADNIERDLAMAHEAIGTLSDKELYKKAWGYTKQLNVIEVWLEHLRHQNEISSESLDRLESQVG